MPETACHPAAARLRRGVRRGRPGCHRQRSRGDGHGGRRRRAVHHRRAGRGPRRPAGAPAERALPRPARRRRVDLRQRPRLHARADGVLARRVRLARAGAGPQPLRPLQDRHRRARCPLHPPARRRPRRVPADDHPRLARLVRGVPQDHRAADRPGRPRGRPCRRLPPGRPVDSGLRLLGPAARGGLQPAADGGNLRQADGPPRLRPLRHAGRRLRIADQPHHRAHRSAARRRRASQPVRGGTAAGGR